MKNRKTDNSLAFIRALCTALSISHRIGNVWFTNFFFKKGKSFLRYLSWFILLSIMCQLAYLRTRLIIIRICYFRWIITVRRRIRIRNSVGVLERSRIGQRSWIERRRVFPVVPEVGGIVLLLWLLRLLMRSIRIIVVGMGTNDVLWTAGRKPFGLKRRRRWWSGRRVVYWFHGGWNYRLMRIESRSWKDLSGVVSICKFKTKDVS
jgi:hypothetical protein